MACLQPYFKMATTQINRKIQSFGQFRPYSNLAVHENHVNNLLLLNKHYSCVVGLPET